MRELLAEIVKVIRDVPNRVSIAGHTDAHEYANIRGYTNWELSADRANTARRELLAAGMPADKLARVVGLASSVLFDSRDPYNPVNRRISITVMNRAAEEAVVESQGPGDSAVSAPATTAGQGSGGPSVDAPAPGILPARGTAPQPSPAAPAATPAVAAAR